MVGFGETEREVVAVFRDLFSRVAARSRWGNTCRLQGIICRCPNMCPRNGSTFSRKRRAGSASVASCRALSSVAPTTNPGYERQTCGAEHPARGHGRFLRIGRAARRPGAARKAGDRRRRRAGAASWRPQLRGAQVRRALRHAGARGVAALPGRDLRPAAHVPLRGGFEADLRRLPRFTPLVSPVARRGLPRRHREHAAVRARRTHRAGDQAADPRGTGSPRPSAWRRTSSWRRSRRTCASPTGSWSSTRTRVEALLDPLPIGSSWASARRPGPRSRHLGSARSAICAANPARLRPIFGRYAERVHERAAASTTALSRPECRGEADQRRGDLRDRHLAIMQAAAEIVRSPTGLRAVAAARSRGR